MFIEMALYLSAILLAYFVICPMCMINYVKGTIICAFLIIGSLSWLALSIFIGYINKNWFFIFALSYFIMTIYIFYDMISSYIKKEE